MGFYLFHRLKEHKKLKGLLLALLSVGGFLSNCKTPLQKKLLNKTNKNNYYLKKSPTKTKEARKFKS
jgi:hypothetical protein